MAPCCSQPSTSRLPLPISGSFLLFKHSDKRGCFKTMLSRGSCGGAKPKISLLQGCILIRPMIQTHVLAINAQLLGQATRVHLTETCEDEEIHPITHVETT